MIVPVEKSKVASKVVSGLLKVSLALKNQSWKRVGSGGLHPTQVQILTLMRTRGEGGMRLSEVAQGLGVTVATASDSVNSLARKGFLKKAPSKEDGRAVVLRLTAKGRREADRHSDWPDALLGSVEALSEAEQVAFFRGMVKMIRTLQVQGLIPVSRMCVTCVHFRPYAHKNDEKPHHCALADVAFGDRDLKLDCGGQEPLPPAEAQKIWKTFNHRRP